METYGLNSLSTLTSEKCDKSINNPNHSFKKVRRIKCHAKRLDGRLEVEESMFAIFLNVDFSLLSPINLCSFENECKINIWKRAQSFYER